MTRGERVPRATLARSDVVRSGRRARTPSPLGSFGGCHSVRRLNANEGEDDEEDEDNANWRSEEVVGEAEQRGRFRRGTGTGEQRTTARGHRFARGTSDLCKALYPRDS